MYSVYALSDPRTNEMRYIGRTLDIQRRFKNHVDNRDGNSKKRAWIEELKSQGLEPVLTILEDNLNDQDSYDREHLLIIQYRDAGAPLLNYQYSNPARPYKKHKRLTTLYVVASKNEYDRHKALGHRVEYVWDYHEKRQQSAG